MNQIQPLIKFLIRHDHIVISDLFVYTLCCFQLVLLIFFFVFATSFQLCLNGYYLNIYLMFFKKKMWQTWEKRTMIRLWSRPWPCVVKDHKIKEPTRTKKFRKLHGQAMARSWWWPRRWSGDLFFGNTNPLGLCAIFGNFCDVHIWMEGYLSSSIEMDLGSRSTH